jgi:hypothetical protein
MANSTSNSKFLMNRYRSSLNWNDEHEKVSQLHPQWRSILKHNIIYLNFLLNRDMSDQQKNDIIRVTDKFISDNPPIGIADHPNDHQLHEEICQKVFPDKLAEMYQQ